MSSTETLPLIYPIELGDKTIIKELVIQKRIKGKHLRSVSSSESELEQGLGLIASLSGLEADIIDEMDEVDIKAAMAVIKKNSPETPAP